MTSWPLKTHIWNSREDGNKAQIWYYLIYTVVNEAMKMDGRMRLLRRVFKIGNKTEENKSKEEENQEKHSQHERRKGFQERQNCQQCQIG